MDVCAQTKRWPERFCSGSGALNIHPVPVDSVNQKATRSKASGIILFAASRVMTMDTSFLVGSPGGSGSGVG